MFTPDMLDMPTAMAESSHTEDYILNLGLETDALVFMVVVPELGACRVPAEALSHFMAGENEYAADKMPEHWSGQLSGKWFIKRTQLRVLAESWAKRMALRDRIYAYLEHQQEETELEKAAAPAPVVADEIDFTLVATRKELIDAFGKFTDMSMTWFDNLTDTPKLKAARKFAGQGGRHSAEPLFCPYEVMQWLADPKRKKGKQLNDTTAWRLLKNNFPKVYNQYSIGDPNAD